MALQKAFTFDITGNGTSIVTATGGLIINAIEMAFFTTAGVAAACNISLQDGTGTTTLWAKNFRATNTSPAATDVVRLLGLNIPTTSNGGLQMVASAFSANSEVVGTIVYTVP